MKKNEFNITEIPFENSLRHQIHTALQGNVVDLIMKIAKVRKTENYWRHLLEGHSFRLDNKISKKLYDLCHEVKTNLGFEDQVDFYITGSSEVNASAMSSVDEGEPHIINIHSSLLQLMTDDELKFIIGHEIGHLISKNADLYRVISFIFPPSANIPAILHHKIRLWNQLSELVADRYGYMACPDLSTCISAFFKMSSGMDSHRVDLDVEAFMKENDLRLEYFQKAEGLNVASHPINPIRVKAIELFSQSELFANESGGQSLDAEALQDKVNELIQVLLKIKSSELDKHITYFIASAGFLIANIDDEFDDREREMLIKALSDYTIFPGGLLDQIEKEGDAEQIFVGSLKAILEINPGERERMLTFMIQIAMADKLIKHKELEFIFHIGQNAFGYSAKEVAQVFAGIIQQEFLPSVHTLS